MYSMGGDCEDLVFLFVPIVRTMGYDAVLVSVPSHLAAVVSAEGLSRDRYAFEGVEYYYCKTSALGVTGLNLQGFKGNVGDMLDPIRGVKAYLYRANPIS